MELKDVILSTLAEMEEPETEIAIDEPTPTVEIPTPSTRETVQIQEETRETSDSELQYLEYIRERLLVLFEGFQAPNNANIEAKVDMTLNFLEYTLATIDDRVIKLQKREK